MIFKDQSIKVDNLVERLRWYFGGGVRVVLKVLFGCIISGVGTMEIAYKECRAALLLFVCFFLSFVSSTSFCVLNIIAMFSNGKWSLSSLQGFV